MHSWLSPLGLAKELSNSLEFESYIPIRFDKDKKAYLSLEMLTIEQIWSSGEIKVFKNTMSWLSVISINNTPFSWAIAALFSCSFET